MRSLQRIDKRRRASLPSRHHTKPYAVSVAGGREYNQDNVRALSFNPRQNLWRLSALLVVADGMGGHEDGVVASEVAVDTIVEVLGASRKDKGQFAASWFQLRLEEVVRRTIKLANKRIYARGVDTSPGRRMGTTLILVAIGRHGAVIGHVGDSRAYQLTTKGFHQLTQDHSFVAEARRSGTMTEEEAARSPYRSHITRTVGTKEDVEPDVIRVSLSRPLAFLLCSDGLTTVCTDAEIEATIREYTSAEKATRALVELAGRNHTEDNVSVVISDLGHVLGHPRVSPNKVVVWAAALLLGLSLAVIAMSGFYYFSLRQQKQPTPQVVQGAPINRLETGKSGPANNATKPDTQVPVHQDRASTDQDYPVQVVLKETSLTVVPAAVGGFRLKLVQGLNPGASITQLENGIQYEFRSAEKSRRRLRSKGARLDFLLIGEDDEVGVRWYAEDAVITLGTTGRYLCQYVDPPDEPIELFILDLDAGAQE